MILLVSRDPVGSTLSLGGEDRRWTKSTGKVAATRYYSFSGTSIASRNLTGLTWLAPDQQGTGTVALNESTQAAVVRRQKPFGESRERPSPGRTAKASSAATWTRPA